MRGPNAFTSPFRPSLLFSTTLFLQPYWYYGSYCSSRYVPRTTRVVLCRRALPSPFILARAAEPNLERLFSLRVAAA